METHNHSVLKQIAIRWLYEIGCRYITTEVKVGKYIYDVVGLDGKRVFIIEAKQDYNDFIRDCNDPEDIKKEIYELKKDIMIKDPKDFYKELEKIRNKNIKLKDNNILKMSTHRYIIAPDDLIEKNEIPDNWGFINEYRQVKVKCVGNRIDSKYIEKMIRNIARKNTKSYLESIGVNFDKKQINWPEKLLI